MTQQLIDKETKQDAFLKLNDDRIEQLANFGKCQTFAVGETLIEAGEKDFDFYIVTSGILEVIDRSSGEDKTIAMVREKEFIGYMSNLKGHPAVASVIVKEDCEVCAITTEKLKQILGQKSGLSDLILQTFIARCQALKNNGYLKTPITRN